MSFPRRRESRGGGACVGKTNFGMELGHAQEAVLRLHPASKRNGALYIGVTSDLPKRVYQHKNDLVAGFTQKYRVHDLVPASWGYR